MAVRPFAIGNWAHDATMDGRLAVRPVASHEKPKEQSLSMHSREWPELVPYTIVTIQTHWIASHTLSPCWPLKVLLVHSRSGVVPFTCMMALPLSTLCCDAAEWVLETSDGSHHNLWNTLPTLPNLAVIIITNQLLSMHTTARASEHN